MDCNSDLSLYFWFYSQCVIPSHTAQPLKERLFHSVSFVYTTITFMSRRKTEETASCVYIADATSKTQTYFLR